jgi:hypothetical protein
MNMAEPIALRGTLRQNEPMAKHVSWRTGGPAARAYAPADATDLASFLRAFRRASRCASWGWEAICWCATAATAGRSS